MPRRKRRKTAAEIAEARTRTQFRAQKGIQDEKLNVGDSRLTNTERGNAVGRKVGSVAGEGAGRAMAAGASMFFDALLPEGKKRKGKRAAAGNPFK